MERYARQIVFPGLAVAGQRRLNHGRVLVVGVGGLGSWTSELLTRAGVGFLRLVDDDVVELANIHRQSLYDEGQATQRLPKVHAAAARLAAINSETMIDPVQSRMDRTNIARLAEGVNLIVDGTDNFAARFLINDYAVKAGVPWVMAGVVQGEGQVMSVLPGRSACLRCVLEELPLPCQDRQCRSSGVLGPAVAAVAAIQTMETLKILADRTDMLAAAVLKVDLWGNKIQEIAAGKSSIRTDCPCCGLRDFEFLDG
jgi:adenylyltransferase/sulfurtransferase